MSSALALTSYSPELKKRIFFTLSMLVVYRLGVFIPTPGIDNERLQRFFDGSGQTLFGMVNMFSGGALEQFSVFALGIMPYISVSIIVQVLSATLKPLEELQKQGEQGKRIIQKWTRIGTIGLAMFQGVIISMGLERQGVVLDPGWSFRLFTALTLTAGTAFLMWIGEQVNERGIGNGISILIMAGILARMPSTMASTVQLVSSYQMGGFAFLSVIAFAIATVFFIVFVERAQRKIPVQYPRRSVGRQVTQPMTQHLPLKLNSASVMPPIFASALIFLPATFAQVSSNEILQTVVAALTPPNLWYQIVFGILIVIFAYFYTSLIIDPNKMADNLKRNGGFIPTVRPGKDTAQFLYQLLNRLTFWGSIYLVLICIIPTLVYFEAGASAFTFFFGGTAILIVVGVTMDTFTQIESHARQKQYEEMMTKKPGKVRAGQVKNATSGRGLIQR